MYKELSRVFKWDVSLVYECGRRTVFRRLIGTKELLILFPIKSYLFNCYYLLRFFLVIISFSLESLLGWASFDIIWFLSLPDPQKPTKYLPIPLSVHHWKSVYIYSYTIYIKPFTISHNTPEISPKSRKRSKRRNES